MRLQTSAPLTTNYLSLAVHNSKYDVHTGRICFVVLFGEKGIETEPFKHAEDPGKAFILKKYDWKNICFEDLRHTVCVSKFLQYL